MEQFSQSNRLVTFAGLSSLAEEVNKSYVASLGSVAETARDGTV